MKAILIDARNKEIKTVEYCSELKEIYELLDCKTIDRFYIDDECCYIDDEGVFNSPDIEFYFNGFIYHGNGLIVGTGKEGEDIETCLYLEQVKKFISFPILEDEKWMHTFLEEKGIKLEDTINGEITVRRLLNYISRADVQTQKVIKDKIIQIDLVNGDVMHFFNFLANNLKENS